jgi:hypothetical protein
MRVSNIRWCIIVARDSPAHRPTIVRQSRHTIALERNRGAMNNAVCSMIKKPAIEWKYASSLGIVANVLDGTMAALNCRAKLHCNYSGSGGLNQSKMIVYQLYDGSDRLCYCNIHADCRSSI